MHEPNDNVGDLDTRIIDIVLHLDAFAGGFQDAHKGIAEHGVANVADVRSFVWVDAGMLNHLLRLFFRRRVRIASFVTSCRRENAQELYAIEKDVDVSGSRNLDVRNSFSTFKRRL